MPNPTLTVLLSRSGWILGDAVKSKLGVSTHLGYSSTSNIATAVRRIIITRGRSHEFDRVEAGRVIPMRLRNPDGDFDSTNTLSPYAPDVRPMIPVKIQATHTAVTYDLLTGFIEGWPQRWTRGPAGDSWVEVTAVDGFKVLNLARLDISRGVEKSGARINVVLDQINWPTSLRAIDTGESNVQAVVLTGANALGHIQDVAASEGGLFFIARDGKATFYSRFHTTALDPQDTWGDFGTEKHYEDLTYTFDEANLWNEVTVTAPGLADQTASDSASQSLYGGPGNAPRSLSVATLLTTTGEMLTRAEELLARYSTPKQRVTELSPEPRGEDSQWPRILGKEIGDRIIARKRPPSGGLIDQPSIIEGIRYDIWPQEQRFGVTWSLSSTALQQGQWQLGVVGKSELGVTTSIVTG